jgi:hypothetical protein
MRIYLFYWETIMKKMLALLCILLGLAAQVTVVSASEMRTIEKGPPINDDGPGGPGSGGGGPR